MAVMSMAGLERFGFTTGMFCWSKSLL